jgi:hypothetical protein
MVWKRAEGIFISNEAVDIDYQQSPFVGMRVFGAGWRERL